MLGRPRVAANWDAAPNSSGEVALATDWEWFKRNSGSNLVASEAEITETTFWDAKFH